MRAKHVIVKQIILHTVQKLKKYDRVKLEGRGTEDAICLNQSELTVYLGLPVPLYTVYYEGRLVYLTE